MKNNNPISNVLFFLSGTLFLYAIWNFFQGFRIGRKMKALEQERKAFNLKLATDLEETLERRRNERTPAANERLEQLIAKFRS